MDEKSAAGRQSAAPTATTKDRRPDLGQFITVLSGRRPALGAEILKAGGDPGKLLILRPIDDRGDGITHVEATPKALSMAFRWIHQSLAAD